jgi:hypothetical protein
MGGKQSGRRKQIYLCVAILIFLSPSACALNQMVSSTTVDATGEEALEHLALGRQFLARGEYGNALKENERVLSLAGRNTPVAEALFYVGLIHSLPANPARNQGKSVVSFKRLIKEYPGSSLVEPAKAMVELLQESDNLIRRVDRLNNTIDELKKVDIDVEQKKAEHAKTIGGLMHENDKLTRMVDRLNNIIDELKKVDIGVDQKKREQRK